MKAWCPRAGLELSRPAHDVIKRGVRVLVAVPVSVQLFVVKNLTKNYVIGVSRGGVAAISVSGSGSEIQYLDAKKYLQTYKL